jgi:hypothetical protein
MAYSRFSTCLYKLLPHIAFMVPHPPHPMDEFTPVPGTGNAHSPESKGQVGTMMPAFETKSPFKEWPIL